MQCISVGVYNELFLKTISCFPVSFHFSSSSQCIVVFSLSSILRCAQDYLGRDEEMVLSNLVFYVFYRRDFLIYCITFPDIFFFLSFTPLS